MNRISSSDAATAADRAAARREAESTTLPASAVAAWGAAIEGAVIRPGSPEYETARMPPMVRFENVRPAAIVRCTTPADVVAAIAFARYNGLEVAPRCGGHSVAGRSSTEGILIDVSAMSSVSVAGGVARVGAGVRLGALYDALAEHGLTIPAGCGSSVGIAGLTLGGGIGVLGRKYGLTCDRMLRAEVVLANGRVVQCDEHTEEELFWALRGAGGGNFGVVTSFVFRTVSAPPTTVFHVGWPLVHAAAVVQAWQAWAPTGPDELDATLRLTASGDAARPPVADLFGVVLGSEADATAVLDELVAQMGAKPAWAVRRQMAYREAKRYLDGLEAGEDHKERAAADQPSRPGPIFSKSEFFRCPLPRETIVALVENLARGLTRGHAREVSFLPWGGAYNRVPTEATAFAHRAELFLVQHLVVVDPDAATTGGDAARDWLGRSWALLHPWGSGGVYPNFPDPELRDWARAYHGDNYHRLVRVKGRYDPGNVFHFHQSVRAAAEPTADSAGRGSNGG
jgi:FAD/FMN-containing dehydrogenase